MRQLVRLVVMAVIVMLSAVAPVPPAAADGWIDGEAAARPQGPDIVVGPPRVVVEFTDEFAAADDDRGSGHRAHGGPSDDGIEHGSSGIDRAAANAQAAEMLAEVQARWASAQSAPPEVGANLVAGGFSVVYSGANPTPEVAKPAIEESVATWGAKLNTRGTPVVVEINWKSFGNPGVLGFAGPTGFVADPSLPSGYGHPLPLANALAGFDVNGPAPEIVVFINADHHGSGTWHYGAGPPPANTIDLRTVVTHEVGHGVGFVSSAGTDGGSLAFESPPFVYDALGLYQGGPIINAPNVPTALTSGNVQIQVSDSQIAQLYAPGTWAQGTSFSHFDLGTASLMTPSLSAGTTNRAIDGLTMGVMAMMGWPDPAVPPPPPPPPPTFGGRALDDQIQRVYLAHLERRADAAGFEFWRDQRANGLPLGDMIAAFQASPEFIATYGSLDNAEFVTLIYNNVLGRDPDGPGLAHWTALLDSGVTRAAVTEGFVESAEFVSITDTVPPYSSVEGAVRRLYQAFFEREAAPADITYWVGQHQSGIPLVAIADYFATSTEFVSRYGSLSNGQFVNLVYENVLGRAADAGGFTHWTTQLAAGMSRGEMMLAFSQSPEFIKATGTIP